MKSAVIIAQAAVLVALSACASGSSDNQVKPAAVNRIIANTERLSNQPDDCLLPSGILLVRQVSPKYPPATIALGLYAAGCHGTQDTTEAVLSSAPKGKGFCTQLALSSENPGFDLDRRPAFPLRKVFREVGPSCQHLIS
jgi:hypothetical protein